MNGLNPDLLFQRMAGGALRGVAESEDILMRRCNGVMENGRRCSVVPIPGHEYCKACEAKEARGEMPALAVVKLPVEPLRAHNLKPKKPAVKTVISDNKLSETTAEKPPMSDADFNAFSEMLYQSACGDDTEAIIQAPGPGYQDGFQIPTIASTSPPRAGNALHQTQFTACRRTSEAAAPGTALVGHVRCDRIPAGDVRRPRRQGSRDRHHQGIALCAVYQRHARVNSPCS